MEEQKTKKNKKIEYWNNFKIVWRLMKPYREMFFLLTFIVLVLNIFNVITKYLFKEVVDYGTKYLGNELTRNEFVRILWIIMIVYVGIYIIRAIGNWLQIHFINRIDSGTMFEIKRKFFNHIIGLSHKFHASHKTGSMISRIGRGTRAVEGIVDFLVFNGAPLIFQLVLVTGSLLYFDKISAIIVLATAIIFMAYSLFIVKLEQKPRMEFNEAEDREKGVMADFITNIDSIKYFGKESGVKALFLKFITNTRDKMTRGWDYYRWLESGQALIISTGLFFVVLSSAIRMLNNELSIGTFVFIYTIFGNVTEPLFGFVWGIRRFYDAMVDFQALFEYDKVKNEIIDHAGSKNLTVQKREVEFKNVMFKYRDRNVVDDFNLKVNANEKVALVGHSGSGKTTLVKLLYRFYDVNSGGILIDGKNIKTFKQESLRSELSIVPQECILFDDTIYNNIAFSRPSASKQEVMKAIQFAQLDEFVKRLPEKEKTIVGERGVKLSGGEKQRVSIARALLANKKILVLDEATSALDSKTEHEIQEDLAKLMKGRTSIIIAHRLSTIMNADKIVVLSKGKIAQIGKHNELIRQQGIYRELWSLQKGGYIGQ